MVSRADDNDRNHDDEPAPSPDPLDTIWRTIRPALEITGLCAMYGQHESTALATQCLVIVIQSYMDHRSR